MNWTYNLENSNSRKCASPKKKSMIVPSKSKVFYLSKYVIANLAISAARNCNRYKRLFQIISILSLNKNQKQSYMLISYLTCIGDYSCLTSFGIPNLSIIRYISSKFCLNFRVDRMALNIAHIAQTRTRLKILKPCPI